MVDFWLRKTDRPNLVLAPMAGYTDSAFRLLCKELGADIVMTELVSADAIYHNKKFHQCHPERSEGSQSLGDSSAKPQNDNLKDLIESDKTLSLMKFDKKERPLVIQLFGKYPEKFAFASKWVTENLKPDGIDINMGCPARKVVGSDHGAALLKNPKLAVEIIKAVREQIDIPLSVKTRLGWESDDEILEFAPKLVEAGIDAIIIHGRTYKDGFSNISRWDNIYKIKSELLKTKNYQLIAVIGNGDIKSYNEAIERSESNGIKLDGVAIGRATFGKPWVFQNLKSQISNLKLKETILKHVKLSYKTKGDHGIIEFRKHLLAYMKGLSNAKDLRREAVKIETVEDVKKIVQNF